MDRLQSMSLNLYGFPLKEQSFYFHGSFEEVKVYFESLVVFGFEG